MSSIDLIVLGIIKKEPMSAYDIQKTVEYRKISQWVKISTPSIYKKVIQLEQKGYIKSTMSKGEKTAEKAVYSLTEAGEKQFEYLMMEIALQPVAIFLDFNAVIVNLENLAPEKRLSCVTAIENQILFLKSCLLENIETKEDLPMIPATGKAVLRQQFSLAEELEKWIASLKKD